jgi:hypothetical protein
VRLRLFKGLFLDFAEFFEPAYTSRHSLDLCDRGKSIWIRKGNDGLVSAPKGLLKEDWGDATPSQSTSRFGARHARWGQKDLESAIPLFVRLGDEPTVPTSLPVIVEMLDHLMRPHR